MSLCSGSLLLVLAAAAIPGAASPAASPRINNSSRIANPPQVQDIRFWSFGDVTRFVMQTRGSYQLRWEQLQNPSRVVFDLSGLKPPPNVHLGVKRIIVHDQRVREVRVAEVSAGKTRIVFDLNGPAEVNSSQLVNPDRLIIEVRPRGTTLAALAVKRPVPTSQAISWPPAEVNPTPPLANPPPASMTPAPVDKLPAATTVAKNSPPPISVTTEPVVVPQPAPVLAPVVVPSTVTKRPSDTAAPAKSDSEGEKSLVRIFGLKMGKVVIDAGHGGHDTGTIGPDGLMEKDLVLDVALRLGKLINQRLGATVVYTRADDTFIPLEQRTKIANDEKADLFISIHANSSPEPSATGVETYFFNLTSDKSGLDLATRENATSASSISDLNDLLHKAVLQTKKEESRQFAQDVQTALWTESVKMNTRSRDRGVRQAPFVVLIGAGMPSILAEVGFVSNPHDERLLKRSDERQRLAEALFKGVSQYANSLSHLQVARSE
jgi:N-acetylmuramoyl-L-alanine amidase